MHRSLLVALSAFALVIAGQASVDATSPDSPPGAPRASETRDVGPRHELAATQRAVRTGRDVPVGSLTTETRTVTAHPDGTLTAEMHARPVRVEDGTGWQDVDATLVTGADGRLEPRATVADVSFGRGGDDALVRFTNGPRTVAITWPGILPEPQVDDASAVYAGVFRGVDLRVTATVEGFTLALVVHDREAAADPRLRRVTLGVRTTGASLTQHSSGSTAVLTDDGRTAFAVGAPMSWDSRRGQSRLALGEVETTTSSLTIVPPRDLLTDPATQFPVYIDPPFSLPRKGFALVFSGHPNQSYWGGDGENIAKVGDCDWANCNGIGVARSYFSFDASFLRGRQLLSGEFRAFERYAPSCSARPVHAWSTRPVSSATTWAHQPDQLHLLGQRNAALGYSSACPGNWLGFTATRAVRDALDYAGGRATIMLRAGDEADRYGWKKFSTNPVLSVTYNTLPSTPTGQLVAGRPCAIDPDEPHINPQAGTTPAGPELSAVLADPDGGLVRGQFEYYTRTGPLLGTLSTPNKASRSRFAATIPAQHAADGARLRWRVRGYDGTAYGPWGAWCDVTIDRSGPAHPPGVVSTDFPECPRDDPWDCPVGKGVGEPGSFTFTAPAGSGVKKFRYWIEGYPTRDVGVGADGRAVVEIVPATEKSVLQVVGVDAAGNESPAATYDFWASRSAPPEAHWRLEGIGDMGETAVMDEGAGSHNGTFTAGPVKWVRGRDGAGLWLDGVTGHVATTAGPAVPTNKTFTVAAWVKLDRLPTSAAATVVSQDGSKNSGYLLQYRPEDRRWSFGMPTSDTTTTGQTRVASTSPAVAGAWTHLIGVYDSVAGELRLYVNGVLQGTVKTSVTWSAGGVTQLGRDLWHGVRGGYLPGVIDDVRVYRRLLTDDDRREIAGQPAVEELFLPLDGVDQSVDASGRYRTVVADPALEVVAGQVGTGAVRVGDTPNPVTVPGPLVQTTNSFTVTAWLRLDEAAGNQIAVSQDAANTSGFALGYRGDIRAWTFVLPKTDVAAPAVVSVEPPGEAVTGQWTHLAAVYDAAAQRIRIYVDGALMGETPATATVNAAGALRIGGARIGGAWSAPFRGAVDDVHVWTGVRTDDQIFQEYAEPVTARTPLRSGQLAWYRVPSGASIVTTGPVDPQARFLSQLGFLAPDDAEGVRTVYSCRNGAEDYFLSVDAGCENGLMLGDLGRLWETPPSGTPTVPVYRCRNATGLRYAANDQACIGGTSEGLLGYAQAFGLLVSATSTAREDHSTSGTPFLADYDEEAVLGVVALTAQDGTAPLYMCRTGTDTFSSRDQGCEGQTFVRRIGHVWLDGSAAGLPELYGCRTNAGERFESLDPSCEEQTSGTSLGFVRPFDQS